MRRWMLACVIVAIVCALVIVGLGVIASRPVGQPQDHHPNSRPVVPAKAK